MNGQNIFSVPTPIMSETIDLMVLNLQTKSVILPDDGMDNDFYTFLLPASQLVNIGDRLVCKILGTQDGACIFDITAKIGGQQINPDTELNLQADGFYGIDIILTLVGTNRLKCEYVWFCRAIGVANQFVSFYSALYLPYTGIDQNIIFTANQPNAGVNVTVDLITLDLIRNTSGQPNHGGKPINLAYDNITDTISFQFGQDDFGEAGIYPNPERWSLLDTNGGETGYWIAGNLRSFVGVTPYRNHGTFFYIVGVPSLASGSDEETTLRSDKVNSV